MMSILRDLAFGLAVYIVGERILSFATPAKPKLWPACPECAAALSGGSPDDRDGRSLAKVHEAVTRAGGRVVSIEEIRQAAEAARVGREEEAGGPRPSRAPDPDDGPRGC